MDRKLRKILTECIRDIETGARDVEGCLQRHADRAAELSPHLELWSSLDAATKAEPNIGSQQRGQHQLLATLSEVERGGRKRMVPFLTPALVKAGTVAVAAVMLIGGAAGASAALGGPDVPGEVLSGIGINEPDRHREMDREQEMERTSEGPGEPDDPINDASEPIWEHARETAHGRDRAFEGSGNAGEGIDNASEAETEQAQTQEQEQTQAQTQEQEQTQEQTQAQTQEQEQTQEQTQAQTQDKEQEQTQEQTMEGPFEGSGNADDPNRHANGPGPAY